MGINFFNSVPGFGIKIPKMLALCYFEIKYTFLNIYHKSFRNVTTEKLQTFYIQNKFFEIHHTDSKLNFLGSWRNNKIKTPLRCTNYIFRDNFVKNVFQFHSKSQTL